MRKLSFCLFLALSFVLNNGFSQSGLKHSFTAPIGVQAYTYRNSFPINVMATLDTIKTLGITEMEGPNPSNVTPADFKKMLDERGISMPSLSVLIII